MNTYFILNSSIWFKYIKNLCITFSVVMTWSSFSASPTERLHNGNAVSGAMASGRDTLVRIVSIRFSNTFEISSPFLCPITVNNGYDGPRWVVTTTCACNIFLVTSILRISLNGIFFVIPCSLIIRQSLKIKVSPDFAPSMIPIGMEKSSNSLKFFLNSCTLG